jgi:hypothetical protein
VSFISSLIDWRITPVSRAKVMAGSGPLGFSPVCACLAAWSAAASASCIASSAIRRHWRTWRSVLCDKVSGSDVLAFTVGRLVPGLRT